MTTTMEKNEGNIIATSDSKNIKIVYGYNKLQIATSTQNTKRSEERN